MPEKKIPFINEEFDLSVFLYILKKSVLITLFIFFISIIVAFLYLRYTPSLYQSISVIQVNEENTANRILEIDNLYERNISNELELLRSKEFLKRTFNKLPLNIVYYIKGTFLSNELYKNSPFLVTAEINNACIYEVPVYIEFIDQYNYKLSYQINNNEYNIEGLVGERLSILGATLIVTIKNYEAIVAQQNILKQDIYYFVLKNPVLIFSHNIADLNITLLNHAANTIQISYSSNNPEKAVEIVNTIAEEFIKYDIEKKKEGAQNILKFIDEQLNAVYSTLDETEKSIREFRKENKIEFQNEIASTTPFPLFTTKIKEFESEILNIDFELLTLNRITEQLNSGEQLNIYGLIATLSGTQSETIVAGILKNIQKLMLEKDQLLNDVTANNLKIKTLEKQISNQTELLKEFIDNTITRFKERKVDLKQKVKEYEKKVFNESGYDEIEYAKLQRLFETNERFFHQFIEKKAEYLISQAGFISQNIILEKAAVTNIPISPIKNRVILVAILIAVLLCFSIIIVRYLIYDEITSINSIKSYTDAPILGAIPLLKEKVPISQLLVDKKPTSMFAESFRTIRTNLQFISHGAGTKVMTISSTISGEGKTFVAINLAGIIASSGKKVILLDLDLRKPHIHNSFDVPNEIGISTLLIKQNSLNECICKTDVPNFEFITAGPIPPNPSELPIGKEMDELIEELEELYDVIIIDTPPIGIVVDAMHNFQKSNYPVYIMKANMSKRSFINNVNQLKNEKNLSNISIVLNGVEIAKHGYGYGYGYYHEDSRSCKKIPAK